MLQAVTKSLLFVFAFSLPLLTACGGDDGGPSTHNVDKAGVLHNTGAEDPLRNCVECHGADLRGGAGPDCYRCHANPGRHTSIRGGIAHDPGDTGTCSDCHGPNNSGGLGPACSTCH